MWDTWLVFTFLRSKWQFKAWWFLVAKRLERYGLWICHLTVAPCAHNKRNVAFCGNETSIHTQSYKQANKHT